MSTKWPAPSVIILSRLMPWCWVLYWPPKPTGIALSMRVIISFRVRSSNNLGSKLKLVRKSRTPQLMSMPTQPAEIMFLAAIMPPTGMP